MYFSSSHCPRVLTHDAASCYTRCLPSCFCPLPSSVDHGPVQRIPAKNIYGKVLDYERVSPIACLTSLNLFAWQIYFSKAEGRIIALHSCFAGEILQVDINMWRTYKATTSWHQSARGDRRKQKITTKTCYVWLSKISSRRGTGLKEKEYWKLANLGLLAAQCNGNAACAYSLKNIV